MGYFISVKTRKNTYTKKYKKIQKKILQKIKYFKTAHTTLQQGIRGKSNGTIGKASTTQMLVTVSCHGSWLVAMVSTGLVVMVNARLVRVVV